MALSGNFAATLSDNLSMMSWKTGTEFFRGVYTPTGQLYFLRAVLQVTSFSAHTRRRIQIMIGDVLWYIRPVFIFVKVTGVYGLENIIWYAWSLRDQNFSKIFIYSTHECVFTNKLICRETVDVSQQKSPQSKQLPYRSTLCDHSAPMQAKPTWRNKWDLALSHAHTHARARACSIT